MSRVTRKPARIAASRKAPRAPARKAAGRKTTTRALAAAKASARKTAPVKAARKAAARKPSARKPAARKAVAARKTMAGRKASAKAAPRKTAARKPAARKSAPRKLAASKGARRPVARRPARRAAARKSTRGKSAGRKSSRHRSRSAGARKRATPPSASTREHPGPKLPSRALRVEMGNDLQAIEPTLTRASSSRQAASPSASIIGVEVRVVRLAHGAGLPLPAYQSVGAAGLDLLAALPARTSVTLRPRTRALLPTGLILELPAGLEAQVRPRSGLAMREGLTVLNSPGTIDSDYRGEVQVLLVNLGSRPVRIGRGDRIAQLVVAPVAQAMLVEVTAASQTTRGAGGFGSTGRSTAEPQNRAAGDRASATGARRKAGSGAQRRRRA